MLVRQVTRIVLLVLSFGLLVWELYLTFTGVAVELSKAWMPIGLTLLAAFVLAFRPQAQAAFSVVAVLNSLSLIFGEAFIGGLSAPFPALQTSVWTLVLLLFPFAFLHFSFTFPVNIAWFERHRLLGLTLLYGSYLTASVLSWVFTEVNLVLPIGFALGLGVIAYQYRYRLTWVERDRLLVVLIGCLVGGVPFLLATLRGEDDWMDGFALILLPLFPLTLVFAVLKENLWERARFMGQFLHYSLLAATGISAFFLVNLGFVAFLAEEGTSRYAVVTSVLIALAFLFPLHRWLRAAARTFFPKLTAEHGAFREATSFQKIEPNPYIVGNPVRSPSMFFGREEDFKFVKTRLTAHTTGCVILLLGRPRSGKTSILYQILDGRLGPDFVPVFVDMQAIVVSNEQEFLQALQRRIEHRAEHHLRSDQARWVDLVRDYAQFDSFIDSVLERLMPRNLVLLIDEYEIIGQKVREGKISCAIYGYLNSLLERTNSLHLVLAGSRPLEADPNYTSLLGRSAYREISFLARKDAEALITKPLEGKVLFGPATLAHLYRLTHGQPFFVQLLCQNLVDLLNERGSSRADMKTIEELLRRLLESPPPQLMFEWQRWEPGHKLVMSSLAALLKDPETFVSANRIESALQSLSAQCRQQLAGQETHRILEELRTSQILDRDQTRYRYKMDLSRLYIQSEHNIWNVLNEVGAKPN